MNTDLFNNFDPIGDKAWKQKIQFDLKGEDYNDTLITKTQEGIDIKPFYTKIDRPESYSEINKQNSWKNCIKIEIKNASEGNSKALESITRGAESIYFVIENQNIESDILLKNIPSQIPIYIETSLISEVFIEDLNKLSIQKDQKIFLLIDPVGFYAKTGTLLKDNKADFSILDTLIAKGTNLESQIFINTALYQNAGANIVQQLAFGLAHANEYLNHYNHNDEQSMISKPIVFKVAIGSHYFFEIAKIRALRWLWKSITSLYKIPQECHIIAHPTFRNKSILDYNVNMLRTTTECMSAILGGADVIYNQRYNECFQKETEFGTRIALNQLLILKHESYFDKVSNPVDGAYFIESITKKLANKALSTFKNIENNGGFLKELTLGSLQKAIRKNATQEALNFDQQSIVLTGVNKYQNKNEQFARYELQNNQSISSSKTSFKPIFPYRLSEKLEKKLLR